eukprot:gnl/TRDRNA2_/TRDRNA2_176398_c1_seq8.p1 gnl/TRDRNA2_/TRDRNA2_176398_c1~~gnl/TRDRNA2_/TRDRNA2_176398_c1_seq8.p1  ORF type:complete len:320 (+),score=57.42 gnl/TRDRNA2_/TRDRNA2_176398_c1_seq8:99-1058(+)
MGGGALTFLLAFFGQANDKRLQASTHTDEHVHLVLRALTAPHLSWVHLDTVVDGKGHESVKTTCCSCYGCNGCQADSLPSRRLTKPKRRKIYDPEAEKLKRAENKDAPKPGKNPFEKAKPHWAERAAQAAKRVKKMVWRVKKNKRRFDGDDADSDYLEDFEAQFEDMLDGKVRSPWMTELGDYWREHVANQTAGEAKGKSLDPEANPEIKKQLEEKRAKREQNKRQRKFRFTGEKGKLDLIHRRRANATTTTWIGVGKRKRRGGEQCCDSCLVAQMYFSIPLAAPVGLFAGGGIAFAALRFRASLLSRWQGATSGQILS